MGVLGMYGALGCARHVWGTSAVLGLVLGRDGA